MKKFIASLMVIVCLFSVNVNAFTQLDTNDPRTMLEFFKMALTYTEKNYHFGVTYDELMDSAMVEYFKNDPEAFDKFMSYAYKILDENSNYYPAEKFEQIEESTTGNFVGIGITILGVNSEFIIETVIEDSPAEKSGLKPGDVITKVDNVSVENITLDNLISKIRGESGTKVLLTIKRDEKPIYITVVRDTISVNPVVYKKLDKNNAGYIKLTTFNGHADEYVTKALDELSKDGVDKVILDLRNNGGGYVNEAVGIASNFLPKDALILTEKSNKKEKEITYKSHNTGKIYKVVVLINENSASASEIVAGSIKDHKAGVIVGTTSYGKGTMQSYMKMKNGGAIWLTIAEYFLPKGESIHKKGIEPDEYVKNVVKDFDWKQLPRITAERTLQVGDKGEDVAVIKKYLTQWGYPFKNKNDVYDKELSAAVAEFQTSQNLFSYGVADITTQLKLIDVSHLWKVQEDTQYAKAEEIIFNMK